MARRPPRIATRLAPLAVLCAVAACDPTDGNPQPAEQWERARLMWRNRDEGAFRAWRAIDPASPEGARARELLARADAHYRRGIELFREDDIEASREALTAGAGIAPIDPALFLPLARVYGERGLDESAARFYRKLIAEQPDSEHAAIARAELGELRLGLGEVFDPPTAAQTAITPLPLVLIVVGVASTLAALLYVFRRRLAPGTSLPRLIEQSPEAHSAIAYLIGSLRHELLKHRVGAVADVLAGLGSRRASPGQMEFLCERLYGGVPLREAWTAHLAAFSRALGYRFNPRRDRDFRAAGRAIGAIASLRPRLARGETGALEKLTRSHERLAAFDRHLARLQSRLVRTAVDDALLLEVLEEVRGEYAVSSVVLDEIAADPIEEAARIEVPRIDLVLILKNIVRNAIMAVARDDEGRRVQITNRIELEPTGEEVLRLGVRDSSSAALTTGMIRERGMGSGLGLVTTAIKRYGGAIEVRPSGGAYTKEVVVTFLCVFDDDAKDGGG